MKNLYKIYWTAMKEKIYCLKEKLTNVTLVFINDYLTENKASQINKYTLYTHYSH